MDWVHQVLYNMIVTKDLVRNLLVYIDPWDETIAYIMWEIRACYHLTIEATPGQPVFVRDTIFTLASVVEW